MKIKNKMQIITNIMWGGMGYSLAQDSLIVLKIVLGVFLVLSIFTQSMYNNE